ncbi:hypothetical protein JK386_10545 [Nocardioides sp. zg-536]|uniref:Uncharacterized protein n=1 Tax=Nocardioides faecalis TaxID=2803858 RepID=A0A938Y6X7_9ACTN|nr:DUF6282 family protein [Nocardioides faecalis]MBM9460342.1 hypothetical protein [Nocardioides faecalis]QVI59830.1 hypothetical protein KG111_05715 [Nocardioides faecalis]
MMMHRIEDELLVGALDLHAHGYPEFTLRRRPRVTNVEWAEAAAAAQMRGFVIKSHFFPTMAAAGTLQELHPELEIFGSITLNPPVGGLNPTTVEMAAQMGARIAWFPTWSAKQEPPKHSITLARMEPYLTTLAAERAQTEDAVAVVDADGALTADAQAVVEVCSAYGVTVASGHLPPEHSLVLAEAAQQAGARFVLTHPCSGSVAATIEHQQRIAELGGYIEHVFIGCMPMHQRTNPRELADAIRAVGPERCIMSSDAGEAWNPPAPEVLRMFIASMLDLGIDADDVYRMTHDNPALALGLDTAPAAVASSPALPGDEAQV